MPLTARQLYLGSQLSPADFGSAVDPDGTPEEQEAEAIAYLEESGEEGSSILSASFSEVSLPVRRLLSDFISPLTNTGLVALFGEVLGPEVVSLWDAAQMSFGRSELNKRVASNSASYDKDSDQDRIQGNQRLQKLIECITGWQQSQPAQEVATASAKPASEAVETVFVW